MPTEDPAGGEQYRDKGIQSGRKGNSEQCGSANLSWTNWKDLDEVAYVRFASVYREFKGCEYFYGRAKEDIR